jgi:nitrite reductase/ring-hydroxylating ferredoxin subunit
MTERRVRAFVESLRRNRQPKRFDAKPADVDEMRAVIELASGRPGATLPSSDFVNDLHRRLADQLDKASMQAEPAPARLSRRSVIGGIGAAAAAAAAGVIVDRELLQSSSTPKVAVSQELVPDEGSWQPVAAASEVAPGQVVRFSTASTVGFVVNDDGQLSAISGVCTHQGCLLRHNEAKGQLDCPCHRAAFSLQGKVLQHQFPTPLPALPHIQVRENNGQIEINDARPV